MLEREWKTVSTVYGDVRIKVASEGGVIRNFAPEFEDCKGLAETKRVPLKMVWQQANFEYLRLSEPEREER